MYHILIVDEEEHLLWALERNLFPERTDIEVHTAGSGEEGLQIMGQESIDLLISDIKMPGQVDGFQLILRAKEMVPDARVMIITAFGTHRIQNFAERIGISHYIEKPFTVDELRHAVLEVLDEKEGFQGVLSDLELTDIIQMLCLAKRTALLHLKHRDHRGRIVFDAGEVVHAEFDGETGVEAVYTMLDLRQGDIFMQSDFEPVERTIDMGWQDLLLEGVKRTDEQRLKRQREEHDRKRKEREASEKEDDEKAPERTLTPMGLGAAAMASEISEAAPAADAVESDAADDADESPLGLGEGSEGMFFSEAELEEISRASEDAMDGMASADASSPSAADEVRSGDVEPEQPWPQESDIESADLGDDEARPLAQGSTANSSAAQPLVEASEVVAEPAPLSEPAEPSEALEPEPAPKRRRSGTSPGMKAIANPATTYEESGEFELFAAPALNGRHYDESSSVEAAEASTQGRAALSNFVRECPGLKATALIAAASTEVVAMENLFYGADLDLEGLSPRLSEIFGRARRCVTTLDEADELLELQLVLGNDYLLMRTVPSHSLIHVAVVDRQVSLGIALVLMRQFGKHLATS